MPILAIKDYIFGGVVLALLAALAFVTISKNHSISNLTNDIENPKTGWRVRLTVAERDYANCRANRVEMQKGIDDQNEALQRIGQQTEAQRSAIAAALAANARAMVGVGDKIAKARAAKPTGASQCNDVDALILGSVK